MSPTPLLVPGETCWRAERAERVALLIDGEAYFAAVHDALCQARRSVFILAWDIDSRLRLLRDEPQDDVPQQLLPLISECLARNPQLEVFVLAWDFSMIYALEREWRPLFNGNWREQPRLHFCLDDTHPVGASHHQKVVVVDDALAFVGGMDLSKWRWDTSAHAGDEPRRIDPDGEPYPPFHDLMLAVDGPAARALGELARTRWRRANPLALPAIDEPVGAPWPQGVEVDLRDVSVGIARTEPQYAGRAAVREVEEGLVRAIANARESLYIENQFFTSGRIGDALQARLEETGGPQIVIVLPREKDGWLERLTMDVLRARLVNRLRAADHEDRLRVYYPDVPGLGQTCISVHSKLLIADDRVLNVGSANTNNRSMGLDSECNLVIEAEGDRTAHEIARCRARLLAEHQGCDVEAVEAAWRSAGSLIGTIEALGSGARSLRALDTSVPDELDREVPDAALLDPERPVEPDELIGEFVGRDVAPPAWRRTVGIGLLLAALIGLALLWRFTPLGEILTPERLSAWAGGLRSTPVGHLTALAAFIAAALLAVPVSLLIVATALAFGPWIGFAYALLAAVISAVLGYGLGQVMGRDSLRRMVGGRLNDLSQRLADRGILTMVTVRIVPVAPFAVINIVAGASHIRFRDYLLGTLLGMTPGVLGVTLFAKGLLAAVRDPEPQTFVWLAALVVLLVGVGLALRRWASRRRARVED
jgi:phosphatidylserine/phosphatidylglycerophosphate/cardiolipin synthase-like enzyme/membrane protein DedA with SNARE-associated domain